MTVESTSPGTPRRYRRPIFWLCVFGIALGVVSVLFQGTCVECPSQLATLRFVLEATLRKEIPEITQVVPVEPRS